MSSIINNQGESCGVQQPKRRRMHSAHHRWQKQQWENIMKAKEDSASTIGQTSHWSLVNQAQQDWLNAKGLQDCDLSSRGDSNYVLSMSHRKAATVPTSPHSCVAAGGPPPNPHVQNTERPTVVSSMTGHDLQSSTHNIKPQKGSAGQAPNLFSARLHSSLSNLRYTMRIAASTFEGTPAIFRKRTRESISSKVSGENDTYSQVTNSHLGAGNYGGKPFSSATPSTAAASKKVLYSSSATPSTASKKVSSSNIATPSTAASKKVLYSSSATPSTASKKVSPSNISTPSTTALKKVSHSSSATLSRAASKKVLYSSSATPSTASKKVSPSNISTPSTTALKKVSHSSSATLSRAASKKVLYSSSATPSTASKKVSPSNIATPSTTTLKKVSPSSSAAPSRQKSTQSPETLLQQKIRPSNVSKQLFNQNKGNSKQKELASNQTRSLSQIRRSSDVDTRLPVPVGNIKSSFKGVGYFKRTKRWEAHIWNTEESRQEYLGAFYTEEQAARAYDRATLYFRGVSAKLHFKLEDYTEELPRLEALTKDQLTTMLKKQSKGRGSLNPAYPA